MIDINCDGHLDAEGQPTHERWHAARWLRIDGIWARTRRIKDDDGAVRMLKGQLSQLLHDDHPLTSMDEWRSDARTRYPFKCPRCGFDVVVNETPKLFEMLDQLESDGVSSLTIREMVAKLR